LAEGYHFVSISLLSWCTCMPQSLFSLWRCFVRKDVVPSELAVQMNAMMLQALFASGFFIVLLKLGSQTSVMLRSSAQCTSYVAVITSFAIANVLAWVNLPSKKTRMLHFDQHFAAQCSFGLERSDE